MAGGFQLPDYGRGLASMSETINESLREIERSGQERQEQARSIAQAARLALASTAEEFYQRLEAQIRDFDQQLDQDHEVGVKLVTFGQAVTFHVSGLGYYNPALIFFYGETAEGEKVQLIQHVSQISFMLMSIPKRDPNEPKRPFGFAQGHSPLGEDAPAATS